VCSPAVVTKEAAQSRPTAAVGLGGRLERYKKEKAKGIRWKRPRNCRLNGKTERNRRDERDGVLTFGQVERQRRMSSSELGKMSNRCRNRAIHHTTALSSTRETPERCSFAPEVHGFAGKAHRNLVDAKVRRGFVGARVIETG
jgi:hypothetical protein